jgi:hypothetical protein
MKSLLILSVTFLLFQLPLLSQRMNASHSPTPLAYGEDIDPQTTRILWHRTKIDMGYVPIKDHHTAYLKFTNAGEHPLLISEVKPTCEAIQVMLPQRAIAPGEEATLTITYETNQPGNFSCYLTIISNSVSYADVISLSGIGY